MRDASERMPSRRRSMPGHPRASAAAAGACRATPAVHRPLPTEHVGAPPEHAGPLPTEHSGAPSMRNRGSGAMRTRAAPRKWRFATAKQPRDAQNATDCDNRILRLLLHVLIMPDQSDELPEEPPLFSLRSPRYARKWASFVAICGILCNRRPLTLIRGRMSCSGRRTSHGKTTQPAATLVRRQAKRIRIRAPAVRVPIPPSSSRSAASGAFSCRWSPRQRKRRLRPRGADAACLYRRTHTTAQGYLWR